MCLAPAGGGGNIWSWSSPAVVPTEAASLLPGLLPAQPGVDEDMEVRGIPRARPENGVRPRELL